MRKGGICGNKTGSSDGLLQETGACCLTYSECFRYRAKGDQHQDLGGSLRTICRWREIGGCLVNGGEESAWLEEKRTCPKVGNGKGGRGEEGRTSGRDF